MYAGTGLLFPYFQNPSQEFQLLPDLHQPQKPNATAIDPVKTSTISEYDLGGEGDLFKAPEPIMEEPLGDLDPMMAAISMMSCGEEVISTQSLKVAETMQNEQLLSEAFYDCRRELSAKIGLDALVPEFLESKISVANSDGKQMVEENASSDEALQKSVSSGCLSSVEWIDGGTMRPKFFDFTSMNIGAVYGMRRAFSEGDIKTLGLVRSPPERSSCSSEERREKLSRYWNKKKNRNFGRKIKYACRKALADSQPRIRGRFARTEEHDIPKK